MQILNKKSRGLALNLPKGFTLPNFSKKNLGGFTLIELLVVIAIIGILASIVLVSLGGARTRAKDTRIVADLNQVRTMSELISSIDGNYATVITNTDISNLYNDMTAQGGTNIIRTAFANNSGYCVQVKLGSTKWGCVNSGLVATFNLATDPGCAGNTNTADATNIMCE